MIQTHSHSDYSTLDGCATCTQRAQRAAELGQWALALTDHGVLNGIPAHIKACEKAGVQPLLGIEAYYRPDRHVRGQEWRYKRWHVILIAQDLTGWHNLIRLSSESFRSGFYQDPCVDDDLLDRYGEGVIFTTACILGPLTNLIETGTEQQIEGWIDATATRFPGRFYIEIQAHDFDRQRLVNLELVSWARRKGHPLIAGVDSHYDVPGKAGTQKIMALIGTNTTIARAAEKNRERIERGDEIYELGHEGLHMMGAEEVLERFATYHPSLPTDVVQEAVANTDALALSVVPFTLDSSLKMPRIVSSQEEAESRVMAWCRARMDDLGLVGNERYERQLAYEQDIIRRKRNFDYIYLIGVIVRWARSSDPPPPTPEDPFPASKRPIRVGSSRGSAGASLICYLSRITSLDPIGHKLKFERFMNVGRKGQPDIDIDFPDDRRDEVKEFVARLLGRDCVADVAAFGRFTCRAALKDVARILGIDGFETKQVTDLIDPVHDEDLTNLRQRISELDAWANKYPEAWTHAERLENHGDPLISRVSKHAAGVILTPGPVNDFIPTIRASEEDPTQRTAWSETPRVSIVDDFGLVKGDFLSITGMTQQDHILARIAERTGEELDLDQLGVCRDPYDVEQEVMEKFRAGFTLGTNQFESAGVVAFLKSAQPQSLVDLTAINALYRPGPMGSGGHHTYAKRRTGQETYELPMVLEPVLADTFGSLCFQEQIMELFEVLVGYTAAQADDVRKEIDKLNRGKSDQGRIRLAQRKDEFIEHASAIVGQENAERLWTEILPYTGYCLSGDTIVIRGAAGRYARQETTLSELADAWASKTHIGKKLRRIGVTLLAMDADGRVRPARARSVWSNGVKPVYEVLTIGGRRIRATGNHRLLTDIAYCEVDRLSTRDSLVVMGADIPRVRMGTLTDRARGKTYQGCGVPSGPQNPAWLDGRTEMLRVAKIEVQQRAQGRCEFCGHVGIGRKHDLEFAHQFSLESLAGDYRLYHRADNIKLLCNSCHKTLDYIKGERRVRFSHGKPTELDRIVSITQVGEEEVFDVEMDSVEHNFIANGVVSHNSFNRPHASGYSLQAYQDMWLKVHYPADFYAVLMSLESSKAPRAIKESAHFGMSVVGPDINLSNRDFTVDTNSNTIRYGLEAIDGVGPAVATQVVEKAPYDSVEHFDMAHSFKHTKCNKGHRKALVEAGALDSLGARSTWSEIEKATTEVKRLKIALRPGGTFGEHEPHIQACAHSQEELEALQAGDACVVAGIIDEVKQLVTKRGRNPGQHMGRLTLRFGLDSFSITLFPAPYAEHLHLLQEGAKVIVRGKVDDRGQVIGLAVMDIESFIASQREQVEPHLVAA